MALVGPPAQKAGRSQNWPPHFENYVALGKIACPTARAEGWTRENYAAFI
jgi:hypothetical protein